MANSIKFMNEGFDRKYAGIKPSYDDCLYEAIKSLTEKRDDWSDEDKRDTDLLLSIKNKRGNRSNAKLTPDEKEVIKKYNLGDPFPVLDSDGHKTARSLFKDTDIWGVDIYDNLTPDDGVSSLSDVNLADRARKMVSRAEVAAATGSLDKQYAQNYSDMKADLSRKKHYSNRLANIDNEYDEKEAALISKLNKLRQERQQTKQIAQKLVDDSNKNINKLLKKESLKEEYTLPLDDDILAQAFENLVYIVGEIGALYDVVNALAEIDKKVYAKVLTKVMVDEGFDMPETAEN